MALRVDIAECGVGGVCGKFERWEQDLGCRGRVEIQASRQFHNEVFIKHSNRAFETSL
jgi:hypothetical protein